jgi:hypothetical protein
MGEVDASETLTPRIRLVFEDPDGLANVYFEESEDAQGMFDRFKEGLVNVKELLHDHQSRS